MCEPLTSFPLMSRWLLWPLCLGAALLTHAGLLFIPLPDDAQVASLPAAEISVHLADRSTGSVKSTSVEKAMLPSVDAIKPAMVKAETPTDAKPVAAEQVLQPRPIREPRKEPATEQPPVSSPDRTEVLVQNDVQKPVVAVVAKTPVSTPLDIAKPVAVGTTLSTQAENPATASNTSDATADAAVITSRQQVARPVSQRKPKYPRRAIVRNQEGSVRVELLIRTDGRVEQAVLLESSGYPLLDRSVMSFVEKEQFYAALENGLPVASKQLFTYRFVLN